MRIKRSTGPIGQFIGGVIFVLAGLAVVYLMGSDYLLICNRSENSCLIQEKNLLRKDQITTTLNLSDIEKAEVSESRDSKGKSSYQVMLVTPQIRVPLTDVSTGSFGTCQKNATQINQYLHSTTNDFTLKISGLILKALGLLFAVVGGLLVLQSLGRLLKLLLALIIAFAAK